MIALTEIEVFQPKKKMIRQKDMSKVFPGTTPKTFDNWSRDGIITKYKIGGAVFYDLEEVEKLIEKSKVS